MRLSDCHNIDDFRRLAKARLPFPVFDYIDGAADDELTKARNIAAGCAHESRQPVRNVEEAVVAAATRQAPRGHDEAQTFDATLP